MGLLGSWEIEVYVSAACACIMLVVLISTRKKSLHLPPSPPGWPIFGHLFIVQQPLYRCLHALAQQYGPLFYIKMGSAPTVVISSAHWAREFLHVHDRDIPNRPQVEVAKRIMYNNTGLSMLQYGTEWRHARKLFTTQLLTAKQFEMGEKSREEEMALVIKAIQSRAAAAAGMDQEGISGTVDLRKLVFSTLGNIFTRMMFSKRCFDIEDALDGKGGRYKDLLQELLGLFGEPLLGDAIPWLTWLDTRVKRRMDRVGKEIDAFLEDVLVERIESKSSQHNINPQDWLDLLLTLYTQDGKIDKLQIKVALLDILVGGAETMGTPIDWAMAELFKSPRCLRKLQEELDTMVVGVEGNGPKCLKGADVEKLSYLQAIVKETLRLHPSLALTAREFLNTSNEGVQVGTYSLPKKTRVIINNWALGRDPTAWGKDANTFFPERFLDELAPDCRGQNFEYLPFGAGRRMCPGMNIALKIVPFIVANLVHAVNWTIPNCVSLEFTEKCAFNNTMSNPILVKPSLR